MAFQEDRDGYLTLIACPCEESHDTQREYLYPPNTSEEENKSDSDSENTPGRAGGSNKQRLVFLTFTCLVEIHLVYSQRIQNRF